MGHPRFEEANRLLLAASNVGAAASAPSRPLDWSYLAAAADRQGVTPLVHDWVARHPEMLVDAQWASRLHEAYWANHFRNRLLLQELADVSRAATGQGIDLMPLKGAILATGYYRTPALRPFSDVDLLVRPADVRRLGRLLRTLDYREVESPASYLDARWLDPESRQYSWVASREGFEIQIEYRVQSLELTVARLADLDRTLTAAHRRQTGEVWERAKQDGATGLWRISPEDLLLDVAVHLAAKHLDFRVIWLHDIALVSAATPDLDWAYLWTAASRLRVAASLGAALEAAARWVGAPIPDQRLAEALDAAEGLSRFSFERWDRRLLGRHVASLGSRDLTVGGPGAWPVVSALGRLTGWGPRMRALRCVAWPNRAYLEQRGMAAGSPLAYVATCVRRYALRLARLAASDARPASPDDTVDTGRR